MNIGEALAHGLLGGTAAAADHYVSDWREKTRLSREQAYRKEGWKFQADQADRQRTHASSEAGKDRTFRSNQARDDRNFKAGQADADVQRRLQIAQGEADIKEQYRDKGQQFTLDEKGNLIPVDSASANFAPPVAQKVNGQFSYLGVGKDGKGLLKGKSSGSGSGTGAGEYKILKTPGPGGTTQEWTVFRDETGEEFVYPIDPQTKLPIQIPLGKSNQAPVTPEQRAMAEAEAQSALDELQKWYKLDSETLKPWGGSEAAAKTYFTQQALNGTLRNANGQLIIPDLDVANSPQTISEAEPLNTAPERLAVHPDTRNTMANPVPQLTKQHVIDLNNGKIEADTFKNVFGEDALNRYYQPDIAKPTASPEISQSKPDYPVSQILPGHSGSGLGSWARPDYFSQKEQQAQYEQSLKEKKERESVKRQSRISELQSDIDATIETMKLTGTSVTEKMRLAKQLDILNRELKSLQGTTP